MKEQPKTKRFDMRLDESLLEKVDAWRKGQLSSRSRSQAVRHLLELGLEESRRSQNQLDAGDKMILLMLCGLYKGLKCKHEPLDPNLVEEMVYGHGWLMEWKYSRLWLAREHSNAAAAEVFDILDMWLALERGYGELSEKDKDRVASEAKRFGPRVSFPGFHPSDKEHLEIAEMISHKFERYHTFARRSFRDGGVPLAAYRSMLAVFKPIDSNFATGYPRASEVIKVLNATVPPRRSKKNSEDAP